MGPPQQVLMPKHQAFCGDWQRQSWKVGENVQVTPHPELLGGNQEPSGKNSKPRGRGSPPAVKKAMMWHDLLKWSQGPTRKSLWLPDNLMFSIWDTGPDLFCYLVDLFRHIKTSRITAGLELWSQVVRLPVAYEPPWKPQCFLCPLLPWLLRPDEDKHGTIWSLTLVCCTMDGKGHVKMFELVNHLWLQKSY